MNDMRARTDVRRRALARAHRDAAMLDAYLAGAAWADLAAVYGMPEARARQIVMRLLRRLRGHSPKTPSA